MFMLGHIVRYCGMLPVIFWTLKISFVNAIFRICVSLIDKYAKEDFYLFLKHIHMKGIDAFKVFMKEILFRRS